MISTNDVEQLHVFILQVIAERTMPRIYAAPDDDWLMPYYRIVEDREAVQAQFDAMQSEILTLRRRIAALERGG
jgi:hypothetical protein